MFSFQLKFLSYLPRLLGRFYSISVLLVYGPWPTCAIPAPWNLALWATTDCLVLSSQHANAQPVGLHARACTKYTTNSSQYFTVAVCARRNKKTDALAYAKGARIIF